MVLGDDGVVAVPSDLLLVGLLFADCVVALVWAFGLADGVVALV